MVDEISDTLKAEKLDNAKPTSASSKVRKFFIRNFDQYCEATKKVVLLPKENNLTTLVFNYAINSSEWNLLPKQLFGLYLPNDVEIKKFCEQFNEQYGKAMQSYKFKHPEEYFTKKFMTKFVEEEINAVNFEIQVDKIKKKEKKGQSEMYGGQNKNEGIKSEDTETPCKDDEDNKYIPPFRDTKKFLKANIMSGFTKNTIDALISVMGCEYKRMGILEIDIRITALNTCENFNVIGNFEKREMGYVGYAIVAPTEEIKK
jgi:hypothetical protein